ncbi:hypothetical protein CPB85DRAFT_1375382 [Mucidula mucida]|nr:hypothetical protein CPB85DRAFT_1375382 [Mucidula mucida]
MLLLSVLSSLVPLAYTAFPFTVQETPFTLQDDVKVPVHLGVQSRCRDALLCENIFDAVLKKVVNKIDLSLVYVGELDESEPDFGVVCPHGPQECAGDVHQLCVAKYADFSQFWEFIHYWQARTALKCASSAKIDWNAGAGECAGSDGHGEEGRQDGTGHGIERSCTVLINGNVVCVRDGTWKECENGHTANDFIRQINNEYERINVVERLVSA